MNDLWMIRDNSKEDLNFILNSWIRSYRKHCQDVRNDVYFIEHHKIITDILSRSEIKMACNQDDETQIYGYLILERLPVTIIHYCFVKQMFRKMGIANFLLGNETITNPCIVTHKTFAGESLLKSHTKIFNPYKRYPYYDQSKTSSLRASY